MDGGRGGGGMGTAQALSDSHSHTHTLHLSHGVLAPSTPPLSGSLSLHLLGDIQWNGDSRFPPPTTYTASNSLTLTLHVAAYHS